MTRPLYTHDQLLASWIDLSQTTLTKIPVKTLTLDSRSVKQGDTFIAIAGHQSDGRDYIPNAIAQGAAVIIAQSPIMKKNHQASWSETNFIDDKGPVPIVYLDHLQDKLSELAGRLYTHTKNQLIGVTGTNGKTTITQLMAQWLQLLGKKAAVMGTTGIGFLKHLIPSENTTSNAIDVQKHLHQLTEQGAEFTALEVSSHGLIQGRVKALCFSVGIFTNLTRDHLDYHQNMQAYENAKKSLFTEHDCKHSVINLDDPVGLSWFNEFHQQNKKTQTIGKPKDGIPQLIGVSLTSPHYLNEPLYKHTIFAKSVNYQTDGISIEIDGYYGQGLLKVPLIGAFNASNVLLALAGLLSLGFSLSDLLAHAPQLKTVMGRMELFCHQTKESNCAKIVVDYAHTPDALKQALLALRVHCHGKLWVIFGCGGNRDKGKRPLMGAIAEQFADKVMLTDDNPRDEIPTEIIKDIIDGIRDKEAILIQSDRFLAIQQVFHLAKPGDIMLIAGKGHETYQIVNKQSINYSDRESAAKLLME